MFRTVPLSIIRSFSLYTQKWYNSWWWTEELSETCRNSFQKLIWEISASSWFYCKNLSWRTVTWTSKTLDKVHVKVFEHCVTSSVNTHTLSLKSQHHWLSFSTCGVEGVFCERVYVRQFAASLFLYVALSKSWNFVVYKHNIENSVVSLLFREHAGGNIPPPRPS